MTIRYAVTRPGSAMLDVKSFGAKGDGTTDDTTAIQAAVDAAATVGGTAFVPFGTFISSRVTMRRNVRLAGGGDGSILKQRAASNQDFIVLADGNTDHTTIENLTINGNRGFNSSGRGISYNPPDGGTAVGRHVLHNLWIFDCAGDGLYLNGNVNTSNFHGIRIYFCNGYGAWIASHDNVFDTFDIGQSGRGGYRIENGNNRFIGCNAWFSGRVTPTDGSGFTLVPFRANRNVFVGCQAQDSQMHGWSIEGVANNVLSGCMVDGANANGEGVSSGLGGVGIYLKDSINTTIDAKVLNRFSPAGPGGGFQLGVATTTYALQLTGTNTSVTADLKIDNMATGAVAGTTAGTNHRIRITSSDPTQTVDIHPPGAITDPFGFGFVTTFLPGQTPSAATWNAANDCRYARVLTGGTITRIGLHVGVSSGNISLAVYRGGTGTGRGWRPTTRLVTTGAIACPATGYQEVALGSSVTVFPGDWLALSCDNTTAAFFCFGGSTSQLFDGLSWGQATAHPAPTSPSGLFGTTARFPALTGVS